MPIFDCVNVRHESELTKWIRVENILYIYYGSEWGMLEHNQLASADDISGAISMTLRRDLSEADAAYLNVEDGKITLFEESATLSLPRTEKARSKSVTVFQQHCPGYTVVADVGYFKFVNGTPVQVL